MYEFDSTDESQHAVSSLSPFQRKVREAYFARRRDIMAEGGVDSDFGSVPIPRWDGGCSSGGFNYRSVWPSLSDKLIDHKIFSPVDFVAKMVWPPNPLLPPQLKSNRVLSYYCGQRFNETKFLRQKYISSLRDFNEAIATASGWFPGKSKEQLWEIVLTCPKVWLFSALFCYVTAEACGLPGVMNIYSDVAIDQLCANLDGYRSEWSDIVPSDLMLKAEARVAAIVAERSRY